MAGGSSPPGFGPRLAVAVFGIHASGHIKGLWYRQNGHVAGLTGARWPDWAWKGMVRMRGKLMFVAGVAVGYVLGAKAGRERYDQITAQTKRFWESNTVQEAAGVVQAQAGRAYDTGKRQVSNQARRLRHRNGQRPDQSLTDEREPAWDEPVGFPSNSF